MARFLCAVPRREVFLPESARQYRADGRTDRRTATQRLRYGTVTGYDYIAQILKSEGVEWLACFPQTPMIEAAATAGIRPIMFRHERGAVMAADGYSRTSDRRRFGVVAVQPQAGAENALGGLAQAGADNIPVLLLPAGNARDSVTRPNFSATRTFQGVAKQVEPILRRDQIGAVMRRAFHGLRNGAPGPVVVELTQDVCAEDVAPAERTYRSPRAARQVPAADDMAAAVELLRGAERPLIWAGAGVLAAGASAELARLAELLAAPVFCTMPGKSALPETHPLCLGAGSGTTTLAAHRWLSECDVLLALGASLTRSPYAQAVRPDIQVIHNSVNVDDINKDEAAAVALAGDAALTIEALIEELRSRPAGADAVADTAGRVASIRDQWLAEWTPALTGDDEPLSYYRVVHALNEVLDPDASMVTHDAGAPRDCLVPFYRATVPHSYVGWGKTTHLGFGLPLMIGAKLAHPDKFCLNVMGDGAFGMSGLDLETAVRAGIPITTVLLNNGAMATYSGARDMIGPTARAAGVSTMGGNYAALAQSLGAHGIEVRSAAELERALAEAQRLNAAGSTVLIDVHVNIESRRSRFG